MSNNIIRKHKVELSDYDYERDIALRILLADLSEFERSLIEEVVNSSVKTSIKQLASDLGSDVETISPFLRKLERLDLFKINGDVLIANKEMRKYFADEIEKFSDSYEPDVHYLQALLGKVPIHTLPQWYTIPRATDHIFHSILERYFQTPKAYLKHLEEMALEVPHLFAIYQDIYSSDGLLLSADVIMAKYKLSQQQFEKLMLEFEYNLLGCLCYRKSGKRWKEHVTLFHEWKLYCLYKKEQIPPSLPVEAVAKKHSGDFFFVNELAKIAHCMIDQVPIKKSSAIQKEIASLSEELGITANPKAWIRKSKQEQAASVYKLLLEQVREGLTPFTERDLREVEKHLKTLAPQGWMHLELVAKGVSGMIHHLHPIELERRGKKWRYHLPDYSEEGKNLAIRIIVDFLWKTGVIDQGTYEGMECICVTPYGRMSLGH